MEKMRDGDSTRKSCEGCGLQRPEAFPENVDVLDLWDSVQSQWRASGFGLIGLDYNAVYLVAGTMGITVDEEILQKLRTMESITLERIAVDSKAN